MEDELRVVIGPNGAGKTTLLDLICGKTKPTQGSVRFKGQELTGLIDYQITRAGIGRKFQTPSIYQDLTVFENLEISYPEKRSVIGSLFFQCTSEISEKIHTVAGQIFLLEEIDTKAGLLSHGENNGWRLAYCLCRIPI